MEPARIKALLEKYWSAETDEAEERELKEYFAAEGQSDDHAAGALFDYFRQEQQVTMDSAFDERLKATVPSKNGILRLMSPLFKVAAALLVLFSIIYILLPDSKKAPVVLSEKDTYNDPEKAYAEARKALLLISHHLNTGKNYIGEVGKLNQAEQLINSKAEKK